MKHLESQFRGGLAWAADWPAEAPPLHQLEPPRRLRVPLIGQASAGQLPAGVRVGRGELLTEAATESGPAALAPVAGRIVGPCEVRLVDGRVVAGIELEVDVAGASAGAAAGEGEAPGTMAAEAAPEHGPARNPPHDPARGPARDPTNAAAGGGHVHEPLDLPTALRMVRHEQLADWIDVMRRGGIWADRRGSPDLLAQLRQALQRPIDTLLCNLLDADPPLRLSGVIGHRSTTALVAGAELLSRLIAARQTMVVVETEAPSRWWTALDRASRKAGFTVIGLAHRFPQADPTLLMQTLLQRRLRPGRLPTDQGTVLVDAAALVAIGRCCAREQPMLQVPIAIADHVARRLSYRVAPVGMPVREVLKPVGIDADALDVLAGDRLRRRFCPPDAVAAGAELCLHAVPRGGEAIPDACIRCSWCVEHCPTSVQPAGLLEAAQAQDLDLADACGLDACIECGVCADVCPSHLPLLDVIRQLRATSLAPVGAGQGGKR